MGSVPLLSLEAHQDGGIRVVCGSAGWYPQPQVLWKAANGQRLPSVSQRRSSDERGLFEIQDVVVVSGKGDGNLSCVVRNSRLEQDQASSLHISAPFFHNAHHWMAALGVFLVLSVVSLGVIAYLWRRKGERDTALTWRKFLLPENPDVVTLDPNTAHSQLVLLDDRRRSPLPSRIWVCLDCARGLVTFLHADTGVEIFTFPPASFKGETLRPLFWTNVLKERKKPPERERERNRCG
ncbi:butyrophilin subfamily 1 member A1-like [Rissa tridactyla]|uniref:butyrophilin subfamily 1 member A1-like n=1 Tax=Rissa tridactyla TaxID=75485 RepID=UPI0023BAA202|nr:butyrophilin subfamily 1 member A1-like [Rissa tridactyla]